MPLQHNITQYAESWAKEPKAFGAKRSNQEIYNSLIPNPNNAIKRDVWKKAPKKGQSDIRDAVEAFIQKEQLPTLELVEPRKWKHVCELIQCSFLLFGVYDDRTCPARITSYTTGFGSAYQKIVWSVLERYPELLRFENLWMFEYVGDFTTKNKWDTWRRANPGEPDYVEGQKLYKERREKAEKQRETQGESARKDPSSPARESQETGDKSQSADNAQATGSSQTADESTEDTALTTTEGNEDSQYPEPYVDGSPAGPYFESQRTDTQGPTTSLGESPSSELDVETQIQQAQEKGLPDFLVPGHTIDSYSKWQTRKHKHCKKGCRKLSFLRTSNGREKQQCLPCAIEKQSQKRTNDEIDPSLLTEGSRKRHKSSTLDEYEKALQDVQKEKDADTAEVDGRRDWRNFRKGKSSNMDERRRQETEEQAELARQQAQRPQPMTRQGDDELELRGPMY